MGDAVVVGYRHGPTLHRGLGYADAERCAVGDAGVTNPFDDYLDLVEAARVLTIHPQSLRRLIKQQKIPARLYAGKYLVERAVLEMFTSTYDPRPGRKPIRRLL